MPFHGGIFDAAAGIFQGVGGFIQDFASTTFSAIGERFQGGVLSPGEAAGAGTTAGARFGNVLADIGIGIGTGILGGVPGVAQRVPVGTAPSRPRIGTGTGAFELRLDRPTGARRGGVTEAGLGDLLGLLPEGSLLEGLTSNVLDPFGLATAARSLFGGDMPFHTQALPGGFASPVAAGNRIFTPHQNLVTGAVTVRAAREVQFMNPITGKIVTYLNAGRPLLWSGDLSACKRVNRIAARAKRSRPR